MALPLYNYRRLISSIRYEHRNMLTKRCRCRIAKRNNQKESCLSDTAARIEFDDLSGSVSVDGVRYSLRPKTFELLKLLASAPCRVFSKADILAAIWPDTVVEEQAIFQCINELRKAFGTAEAIKTYLFNTQVITLAHGEMAIIAPTECQDSPSVSAYLAALTQRNTPIKQVHYYDVKQSMRNGGGPACLRLRVAMSEQEKQAVNPNVLMNDKLFNTLNQWVDKHYRDQISEADLADPQLLTETRTALDELTQILDLGSVYQFQQI